MPLPFDATLKDLVQRFPADWVAGLGLPATGPVEVLTPDLSTLTAFTDLVLRVGDRLLHLDFQTGPDPSLPRRLLLYNTVLHHHYDQPVHSLVVLLRPRADRSDLTGELAHEAFPGRGGLAFRFEVVRVWQRPAESYLTGPVGLLPLAPVGGLPEGATADQVMPGVVGRLVTRAEQEAAPEQAKGLIMAAFLLSGLLFDKRRSRSWFKGVRAMQDSDTYLGIIEEGEIKALRRMILRLGRKHLGPAPADATAESILNSIEDIERLERMHDRASDATSWQDLLQTP